MNRQTDRLTRLVGFFASHHRELLCQGSTKILTTKEEQAGKKHSVSGKGFSADIGSARQYTKAGPTEPESKK